MEKCNLLESKTTELEDSSLTSWPSFILNAVLFMQTNKGWKKRKTHKKVMTYIRLCSYHLIPRMGKY